MGSSENHLPIAPLPTTAGCFAWTGLLLAILIAPLCGLVWAWMAEVAQGYFAPMILFPILVGVFAGLSIVGLARFGQFGHRPTILLAAVLGAAVAAAGQHYCGYLTAYYGPLASVGTVPVAGEDFSPLLREMRPSFGEYLCAQARRGRPLLGGYAVRGWLAWLTWAVDLLLAVAAAAAVTIPALQVPYCNRCGTWYRTVRGGKIDRSTASRLAELAGVEQSNHSRSIRYRLSACEGGCGPTRCELSWEDADGTVSLVRVWLDAAGRNQVIAILDEAKPNPQSPTPNP